MDCEEMKEIFITNKSFSHRHKYFFFKIPDNVKWNYEDTLNLRYKRIKSLSRNSSTYVRKGFVVIEYSINIKDEAIEKEIEYIDKLTPLFYMGSGGKNPLRDIIVKLREYELKKYEESL